MSVNFPFLPQSLSEAYGVFSDDDRDIPNDCHRHCQHWDEGERCCDCGEQPMPSDLAVLDALDSPEEHTLRTLGEAEPFHPDEDDEGYVR